MTQFRTADLAAVLPSSVGVHADNATELSRRAWPESDHPYRTPFLRDIGRILHAKAFRRLAGKTQVFARRNSESDHARSRLTHTLEVAQIARIIALNLGLNSHLAEALALVHDIGHPPFGHAGEKALDESLRAIASLERSDVQAGFDHNLHALRIVTTFEERYAAFPGLNLTLGVREGIIKHSRDYSSREFPELAEYFLDRLPPLEAQIIDLADEIAYLTADLEDGLGAGILDLAHMRGELPLFASLFEAATRRYPVAPEHLRSNEAIKEMLNGFVTDLMHETHRVTHTLGIDTLEELRQAPSRVALLSSEMESNRHLVKSYLYEHLYQSPDLTVEHAHAAEVIQTLFTVWTYDPSLLPEDHQRRVGAEGAARAVADYIAGMTDAYIEQAWRAYLHSRKR
jgi:dGTPase